MTAHADADHRDLDDIGIGQQCGVTEQWPARFQHGDGSFEISACHSEGQIGGIPVFGGALHNHVDIDRIVGERPEYGRCDARTVGHFLHRDLGFVAAVGDAAHNLMLHDLALVDQKGSRGIGKTRPDVHPYLVVHRHFDRARLQHLGALRCHLQHFFIGDPSELARFRNDARIAGIDTVDVGEDVAAIGLERGRERHRRSVRAGRSPGTPPPRRPDLVLSGAGFR